MEEFCIYAREELLDIGGIENGMIIFGHTPTIVEGSPYYNSGEVYKHYDEEKDCYFFNIDCGCAYREKYTSGKMACLRIEDEKIFYI